MSIFHPAGRPGADLFIRHAAVHPITRPGQVHRAVTAAGTPVWRYLFIWKSGALGGRLGACLSLKLPFVFDTLDLPGQDRFTGTGPPRSLAWRIGAEWTALARHATPGPDWPPYDQESRPSRVLRTPSVQESAQLIKEDDD